jgi:signal transduction histidine kinase
MKLDTTFFRSKVARRIFVLFVFCALVPISALAIISFSQVSELLDKQSQRQLHLTSKSLGVSIFERLSFLEEQLKVFSASITATPKYSTHSSVEKYGEGLRKRFKGLALIADSGTYVHFFGSIQNPGGQSAEEKQHIRSGKTILSTRLSADNHLGIFMMRALDPQDPKQGILFGEINPKYLWGLSEYNTLPSMAELCVLDESDNVIFSTLPLSSSSLVKSAFKMSHSSLNQFEWKYDGRDYLTSFWTIFLEFSFFCFWTIFLEFSFFCPKWTVVLSLPKDYVYAPMAYFKKIFPLVILLSLLLVLLLSGILIRRTMLPIANLKDGTRRIAMRAFDSRVTVTSGDEFQDLATSFNEMAKELGRQFSALNTIEEIHRAILSSLDTGKIVDTVLTRIHDVFSYDFVSVTLVNSQDKSSARTYFRLSKSEFVELVEGVEITPQEEKNLINNREILSVNEGEDLPGYLGQFACMGMKSFTAFPLLIKQDLAGVMVLGSLDSSPPKDEELSQARMLADQVAIALSNARLTQGQKRAQKALYRANVELEKRVKERTSDLISTNEHLQREIAERKQVEVDLKEAKQTADIANVAKTKFLANMSHELRTPLNAIIGFSELLLDKHFGDLNETQDEYLNDVLESSRHLLSLINDILDLSKVEAGKLELQPSDVNIRMLLENSLIMIKEKAMNHGINLVTNMDGIPETISADERQIKQIMYNLLSNAVKFTPDGGSITLAAKLGTGYSVVEHENADEQTSTQYQIPNRDRNLVEISVKDTGIGIRPEDTDRIFNPFEQADGSSTREYQGTGLGLSLTKQLVELHGGKIWAESEGEGKGSTFRFVIPV